MKEEKTKKLLSEGLLHTSGDFTDQLMGRIEKEHAPVRIPGWQVLVFVSSLLVLMFALLWLLVKESFHVSLLHTSFSFPPLPIQLLGLLFVLLAIHKFLLLKEAAVKAQSR